MMEEREPIDLEALATLVRRAIYNAQGATLIGNGPPVTTNYSRRMREPQVGDLVIEASTIGRFRDPSMTDLDAVGILEEIAHEKFQFSDPEFVWDEAVEGKPHPTERIYYIRTFDGRRFRWSNASIIAAPTDLPWLSAASTAA